MKNYFIVLALVFVALGCDECEEAAANGAQSCTNDAACEDGNPCTIDFCLGDCGLCYHLDVSCATGEQCNPQTGECSIQCTTNRTCANAEGGVYDCQFSYCDAGWCTCGEVYQTEMPNKVADSCNGSTTPTGAPAECATGADCNDGNSCTMDQCIDCACVNDWFGWDPGLSHFVCDDGNPCTNDWCSHGQSGSPAGCMSESMCLAEGTTCVLNTPEDAYSLELYDEFMCAVDQCLPSPAPNFVCIQVDGVAGVCDDYGNCVHGTPADYN